MSEYKHGAYGITEAVSSRLSETAGAAVVVFGTAPVGQVAGGGANVNKPIVVRNIAEARSAFGYSDDWAKYTLCEAFHVFFEVNSIGPLVVVNVLDPATHKKSTETSKSLTPKNGRVVIAGAEDAILDTLTVTGKVLGTDYTAVYDAERKAIVLTEVTAGGLGITALTIKYTEMDASAVSASDVIGSTDDMGLNTGLYAVKNVYNVTGMIPAYLLAPGFSSDVSVHAMMKTLSQKISGHWDAWIFADLPIVNGEGAAITLATAATFKEANGYTAENESVYFPMAKGTDGKKYHLATIAAANFLVMLDAYGDLPYHTASNTGAAVIENLYMGEGNEGRVYDDEIINKYLNKYGINSAAYVSGRWVIWGAHAADYNQDNKSAVNVAETTRMMLYYISNDFQARRNGDVDMPLTANDIASIVSEEQSRLDALVQIGALTYGEAHLNAEMMTHADLVSGDWAFTFNVTTTPLAKSLTAVVNWVEDGFETYFAASSGD